MVRYLKKEFSNGKGKYIKLPSITTIKNTLNKTVTSKQFINNTTFDIDINLVLSNERNTFKFNYGLVSLLLSYGYKHAIQKIIKNYLNYDKSLNNIFITFESSDLS
jgi:hypothetical protein